MKISKETENDIYRVEHPNGKVSFKNIAVKKSTSNTVSTTTINVWEIDTTLYQNMFTYWQELLACTASNEQLVIGDLNNNGRKEIYGYTKDYDDPFGVSPIKIYELDSAQQFKHKYTYLDSVIIVKGKYDIDNDGMMQLYLASEFGNGIVYKTPDQNSFPTIVDFVFFRYPEWGQMNDPTFGDFDKNGNNDLVFYEFQKQTSLVFEYNVMNNNFDSIANLPSSPRYCAGYAIGDFDSDGKTDIVYGGIDGEVYIVEADSEHSYINTWLDTLETYNAYMQMATDDIDENGKPEFWVGGAAFYDPNPPITRFTCFEAIGDNQYQEVHRIDIFGIFSFYAGNCFSLDVDKDGIGELVICIEQHVFIFKFNGKPDKPSFELFYVKRNSNPNGVFYGVTMNDLDGDGYEEMLIHQDNIRADGKGRHFTSISKPTFISGINNRKNMELNDYVLKDCYPNPFNSSTIISFAIPNSSPVTIKVFDLLGNEITTIINEVKREGNYEIEFDAENLSSGVYIYRLQAGNFTATNKMILMR